MAKTLAEHNYHGIDATIVADSMSSTGSRLVTYVVTFPRMVLAEFNTHRMFSRNSASSRAIPFKTMLKNCTEHPFIPIAFQKDHKGMQGTEYFEDPDEIHDIEQEWLFARDQAIKQATALSDAGVTKQIVNRLLEPFMWHTVIVTSSEYNNFFNLRAPDYRMQQTAGEIPIDYDARKLRSRKEVQELTDAFDEYTDLDWLKVNSANAEIHICRLAEIMWDEFRTHAWETLSEGEWHIPFGENMDLKKVDLIARAMPHVMHDEVMRMVAVARCGRISYNNFEGKDDYAADTALYRRLARSGHWSPFEHVAQCTGDTEFYGNFQGFKQIRKTFLNEDGTDKHIHGSLQEG